MVDFKSRFQELVRLYRLAEQEKLDSEARLRNPFRYEVPAPNVRDLLSVPTVGCPAEARLEIGATPKTRLPD